ncbi:MAG: 4Fe-4S binding protein [Thermoplasmata archaeon]
MTRVAAVHGSYELLAIVALLMAVATALLVWLTVEARRRPQRWIALFLLAMMGEMWVAPIVYLRAPSSASLVTGLSLSGAFMAGSLAVVFLAILQRGNPAEEPGASPLAGPLPLGLFEAAFVAALVLANEFLMSWVLLLTTGGTPVSGASFASFSAVVNSPWFLFTMAGEMLLSAVLLRNRVSRVLFVLLLVQSAIMVFSPTALVGATWPSLAIYVSSALMIGLFVYLLEYIYRHRQFAPAFGSYLVELVSVYGLMMAGMFVWQYFGDGTTFAISVVLEMVVVYVALARPDAFRADPGPPWQLRPHWAFALLSGVFVAEVCMGAVLSVQLDPADYLGAFPFLALAGSPGTILFDALSNAFWFFATAAASSWFLIMMGLEMGALVVLKFRETKNLENRIRLVLLMGCYAGFAVFYPSIYFALVFPNAPDPSTVAVLGWPMGFGSYPLALGVFGTVLLTYVILGSLSALFGRRVVCSVFCTAPLMYQGTAIDSMKSFNRSSPIARKYLSSRFSAAYSVTMGLVMVALVGTSLLSYLDSIGAANLYIQGTDPSVFFFIASFSVAWYVLFVAIPYAGNYNCVTMGWCYTGIISAAFQKIGPFKLKVRDKQVCWDCKTLDCAKGCPVGLVDMPGHFRQTGEFRSTKCCGVGDCVEDCPYDNLYISDVRHSIRRLLGRPETRPRALRTPTLSSRADARAALASLASPAVPPGATLLPMAGRARPTAPSAARAN